METHLKGFGVENFRVFKDYTWFDFAPITILTGPNSSGKSSLNKALKLISDPTKINDSDLQLGGLERITNPHSQKELPKFIASLAYKLKNYPTKGENTEISIKVDTSFGKEDTIIKSDNHRHICYDLIWNNKLLIHDFAYGVEFYFDFTTFYENLKPLSKDDYDSMIVHSINKPVEDIIDLYSKNIDLTNGESMQSYDDNSFVDLNSILESYGLTNFQCKYIKEQIIGDYYLFTKDTLDSIFYLPFMSNSERNYSLNNKSIWADFIRMSQTQIFNTEEPIEKIKKQFSELKDIDASAAISFYGPRLFVDKWIKIFNFRNELTTIIDTKFGFQSLEVNERPLVEQGTGVSQIIYILLNIVLNPEKGKVFLIEEPEANLHPKFQSLLADMFIDAAKTFNIQFIIETHSEYFIRKMQYLTAKKEVSPTDTNIYYFHDPENIPAGEPQVKKIEILEDGSLSSDFGPGFFDEAANWELELLRLKNNKNRQN